MGLTAKRIARLRRNPGRYHDGHGLYLQIIGSKGASWLLRYERDHREHMLGLGPLHVVGLKEARERAKAARLLLLDGIDPIEARKAKKVERALAAARTMSFADCGAGYIAQHESKWRNAKHREQWGVTLATYVYPIIGNLPVASIDTSLLLRVLEPIWNVKPTTAGRVRGRIEAILDWAGVRGYRSGDNPARWRGHLDQVLPAPGSIAKVEHHAALPYAELPGFLIALHEQQGIAARALEFAILTAARTGEVIGAKWDEIDLAGKTWLVPANRMKGGKEHRVPLSDAAIALLESLPTEDGNPFVFIGAQPGPPLSSMSMIAVLRRMGRGDITTHGFRSCFTDWAHECSNFPEVVIDMALAHAVSGKVERAYRRGDLFNKRRKLMESWAAFCTRPAAADSRTVVPMRSRADV